MPGSGALADELAVLTGSKAGAVECRRFPDGESYVRICGYPMEEVFLVCTLARPDEQFLALIFATRTLRALGARSVGLVVPYLAYLRQDRQFNQGEALSSRIFADLIGREFDSLVTVDPHLHRYGNLSDIYDIPATVVHTAEVIGEWVRHNVESPAVIGPDEESAQWVEEVARSAGCPWAVFHKDRRGDRDVRLVAPSFDALRLCTPVLVDDIIASGATMVSAGQMLVAAGLRPGLCVAVHALFDEATSLELESMFQAVLTTDTVPNRHSRFEVASLIAAQLRTGQA